MNINVLSKYIILFLFAVLVVLSGLLIAYGAENKALQKANAVLKEQVALRDAAINEIDKNIASLQEQVKETEQICDEKLKARNDLLTFLSIEPDWAGNSEAVPRPSHPRFQGQVPQKCDSAALDLNKNIDSSLFVSTNIQNDSGVGSAAHKGDIYEVISKNKSDYAVNSINNYISMFTTLASYSKK